MKWKTSLDNQQAEHPRIKGEERKDTRGEVEKEEKGKEIILLAQSK